MTVQRADAADVGNLSATTLHREYVFDESDNRVFFDEHVHDKTYHYKYKSINDGGTTRWAEQLQEILIDRTLIGNFIYDTADSGLFNMGRRNYAAGVLGRFISRDPIGFAGGLNLYSYGANNPVNRVDHTGLDPTITARGVADPISATLRGSLVNYGSLDHLVFQSESSVGLKLNFQSSLLRLKEVNGKKCWELVGKIATSKYIPPGKTALGGTIFPGPSGNKSINPYEFLRVKTEVLGGFVPSNPSIKVTPYRAQDNGVMKLAGQVLTIPLMGEPLKNPLTGDAFKFTQFKEMNLNEALNDHPPCPEDCE